MADEIQNSINTAIDTIIKNRINALALDKTVIAIIDALVDPIMNIYRVQYDGGYFNAVNKQTDSVYRRGMSVYVQIPQNDMTKEKIIIGRAYATKGSELANSIISAINSYSIMGGNLLKTTENELPDSFALRSYHDKRHENIIDDEGKIHHPISHRAQYFLGDAITHKDYYDLDDASLDIYKESATGLMLQADFRTALSTEQKNQVSGSYGLILNLVFENSSYQYGETEKQIFDYFADKIEATDVPILNPNFEKSYEIYQTDYMRDWEALQEQSWTSDEEYKEALASLDEEYAEILNDIANEYITVNKKVADYANDFLNDITLKGTEEEKKNKVQNLLKTDGLIDMYISYIESITNVYSQANPQLFLPEADAAINSFIQMLKDIKAIFTEESSLNDIYEEYKNWADLAIAPPAEKNISYVLDSNHMTGAPFYFSSWSTQYEIFNIDFSTFKRIDSILFYKDGFISNNDKDERIGDDIFVKNLKIYALQPISAINGDYSLKLNAPDGYIFSEEISENELPIKLKAQVFKQYMTDLSDQVAFQWFKASPAVTSVGHDDYRPYGGLGWKYLERKGNKKNFETARSENVIYENKYKCVAIVDSSVVLSQEFTIYNEAISDNIVITSDQGTLFSFDNGTPLLTACFYDRKQSEKTGEKVYEERVPTAEAFTNYTYQWAIVVNGQRTFLDKFKKDINPSSSIQDNMAAQNLMTLIDGVKFYRGETLIEETDDIKYATRMLYPVRNIAFESNAIFECYIQDNNEEKGNASLAVQNQGQGAAVDYRIAIEGGEQIFQYDEYGGPPNDKKLKTPQEIKPLICHFFNPTGLEVGSGSYHVEWIIPIENTLITTNVALQSNPLNDYVFEIDPNQQCSFNIAELYNESCQNNQIICRVTYNDKTFTQSTNMFFGKVGSNGTNGTDMVLKIEPTSTTPSLDNQPLTLYRSEWDEELSKYTVLTLNDGTIVRNGDLPLSATDDVVNHLRARLFQKNDEITITRGTIRWNVAGSTKTILNNVGKYLEINGKGELIWSEDFQKNKQDNFVIRAWIRYLDKDYYGFYNLPVIEYIDVLPRVSRISIDKKFLLKDIIYNADGRNPIYSHTQGVKLNNIPAGGYVIWEAVGGIGDNQEDCFFSLLENKDSNQGVKEIAPVWKRNDTDEVVEGFTDEITQEDCYIAEYPPEQVYILPYDEYDGGYCNNRVVAKVYRSNNTLLAKITIPIHMSLNTFGLASLNAWDGTSVTVDEEGGYIMAPQIGAGEKDDNNRFTGVVMGKTETYTGGAEKEKQIGVLGYSHGLQSIFLDAETGEATFGLPGGKILNDDGNTLVPENGDDYGEGRVELRPGGISKIGGWQFGKRSLYYTTAGSPDSTGQYRFSGRLLNGGYNDEDSVRHVKDILHEDQGILISADPAYISIKGRVLNANDFEGIDTEDRQIKEGDSLELQFDPDNIAMFAVYRHYKDFDNNNKWTRQMLSGINAKGQLVANNLKQSPIDNPESTTSSSLGIDPITAFEGPNYIGLNLRAGGDKVNDTLSSFFRAFVNQEDIKDTIKKKDTPLYITGGQYGSSNNPDDYSRPISIHGRTVSLWASTKGSNNPITDNYVSVGNNEGFIGIKNLSTTSYYGRDPEYKLVNPLDTDNPKDRGWYELIDGEYVLTEDTVIPEEEERKQYYEIDLTTFKTYDGGENKYIYSVYNLYNKEVWYFDDDGERVLPKDFNFNDTDLWEYHSFLEDLQNGTRYWDVPEVKYPFCFPYEALIAEGSEPYKIDPLTKEHVAIDPLTELPKFKLDKKGNFILKWKLRQVYKDLIAEEHDYWWLETVYIWDSDKEVHDEVPITGTYEEVTRYKSLIADDTAYPESEFGRWYRSEFRYIWNYSRPDIPVDYEPVTFSAGDNPKEHKWYEYINEKYILTEDEEVITGKQYYQKGIPSITATPLDGWVLFKSQNTTYDESNSSFLFLNQRNSSLDYSDLIKGSLLYAQNKLNIESNFGQIDIIAKNGGNGINLKVQNSDNSDSLTQIKLMPNTGNSKNGIEAITGGKTVLTSTGDIELVRDNSFLKIADNTIDLRAKNTNNRLYLINSTSTHSSLHTIGDLDIISDNNTVTVKATGATNNRAYNTSNKTWEGTPGIRLSQSGGSFNSELTLSNHTNINGNTSRSYYYPLFSITGTGFPDMRYMTNQKPGTNNSTKTHWGDNWSYLTSALSIVYGDNRGGGLEANWGYFAGKLFDIDKDENYMDGNFSKLLNASLYAKYGIHTDSWVTANGDVKANVDDSSKTVSLYNHTHPFKKGLSVSISNGSKQSHSITQHDATAKATLNIVATDYHTRTHIFGYKHTFKANGGEWEGGSFHYKYLTFKSAGTYYKIVGSPQSIMGGSFYRTDQIQPVSGLYESDGWSSSYTATINKNKGISSPTDGAVTFSNFSADISKVTDGGCTVTEACTVSCTHGVNSQSFDTEVHGTSASPNYNLTRDNNGSPNYS